MLWCRRAQKAHGRLLQTRQEAGDTRIWCNHPGTAENGTMKYALGSNSKSAPEADKFTTDVPTGNVIYYARWHYEASNEVNENDDLGTENISDFTNTKLNYIIDKRLNDKKSTIITTNLMLSQIRDNYMSQMYSRISHAYISCYLAGEDLRRIKNANI